MKPSIGDAVKSADRVLDLLETLVNVKTPQSFAALSRDLNIPKSSLFQLLRNLLSRGYVRQESKSGCYSLGPKMEELLKQLRSDSLKEIVSPFVDAACQALNETAAFYVRSRDTVIVLSTAGGGQALSYTMNVGDAAPIYAVSAGRAILAEDSAEDLNSYLNNLKPQAFTRQSKSNILEIREVIEHAAQCGFGYAFEEYTQGIVGIGKVVKYNDEPIGALNFAIPVARFDEEQDRMARSILQRESLALEAALANHHVGTEHGLFEKIAARPNHSQVPVRDNP